MDRSGQIRDYLKPYIVGFVNEKIVEVAGEPKSSLPPQVAPLFQTAFAQQQRQPQWLPSYLGLFHLSSSLLTGSHEYALILADTQMYLDGHQVVGHWRPGFLGGDEEMEKNIRKELAKQFVRLNGYEVSCASQAVFYESRGIVGVYWRGHLDEIIAMDGFKKLKKSSPFQFLFGDYMGEAHTVLTYREG